MPREQQIPRRFAPRNDRLKEFFNRLLGARRRKERVSRFIWRLDMTRKWTKRWAVLLVVLAGLLAAVPSFAQVEKATVKINGMI
jgi:hypothetical protein